MKDKYLGIELSPTARSLMARFCITTKDEVEFLMKKINEETKKSKQEVLDNVEKKLEDLDVAFFSRYGSAGASVLFNEVLSILKKLKSPYGDKGDEND